MNIICGLIAGIIIVSACLIITTVVKIVIAAIKETLHKLRIRKETIEEVDQWCKLHPLGSY